MLRKPSKLSLFVLGLTILLTSIAAQRASAGDNPTLVIQGQHFSISAVETNLSQSTALKRGMKIAIRFQIGAQFTNFVFPSTLDDCMSSNAGGYVPQCGPNQTDETAVCQTAQGPRNPANFPAGAFGGIYFGYSIYQNGLLLAQSYDSGLPGKTLDMPWLNFSKQGQPVGTSGSTQDGYALVQATPANTYENVSPIQVISQGSEPIVVKIEYYDVEVLNHITSDPYLIAHHETFVDAQPGTCTGDFEPSFPVESNQVTIGSLGYTPTILQGTFSNVNVVRKTTIKKTVGAVPKPSTASTKSSKGVPCRNVGDTQTIRGVSQICVKNGGALIWQTKKSSSLSSQPKTSPGTTKKPAQAPTQVIECSFEINSKLVQIGTAIQDWNDAIQADQQIIANDKYKILSDQATGQNLDAQLAQQEIFYYSNQIGTNQQNIQNFRTLYTSLTKNCTTNIQIP